MSYLSHIDSSSPGEASVSRQVAQSYRDTWQGPVVHRDLTASPVPHLDTAGITARITDPAQHTPEQTKAAAVQDELIEEFPGADAYLFTVPMYNLTMPSVFKAWLDHIVVADRTVNHAGSPPAAGRPAVVISARGGGYGPGAPTEGLDCAVPALEALPGRDDLPGLDATTVIPELTMAPHAPVLASLIPMHEASLAAAHDQARRLAATLGTPSAA